MKKFIAPLGFVLMMFAFNLSGLLSPKLSAQGFDEPNRVVCHCTMFGSCKASGSGSNCAQSEPGGNIQCSEYDGNC